MFYIPRLVELSIEVTNECPINCRHCSSGSSPVRNPNELSFEKHAMLIEDARALGATVLSLSGGNPLMYERLPELCLYAAYASYERLLIYTTGHSKNANTIDQYKYIDKLTNLPGITFIFSLHSHISDCNDWIMRTPGAFYDIVQSITWLTGTMKIPVEVHMVPMAKNFEHIPDVHNLCNKLGVSKLSLLRFVPQTRGLENIADLAMTKEEFTKMQIIIADEMDREHPVQIRAGCPIDFRHAIGRTKKKPRMCHAGDDLMLVRPNGAVHPCAAWKSLPVDANVKTASLAEIWKTSTVFNGIRSFKYDGYMQVAGCSSCSYVKSCKTGCPAQRLHADGKRMEDLIESQSSDPLCPIGL